MHLSRKIDKTTEPSNNSDRTSLELHLFLPLKQTAVAIDYFCKIIIQTCTTQPHKHNLKLHILIAVHAFRTHLPDNLHNLTRFLTSAYLKQLCYASLQRNSCS